MGTHNDSENAVGRTIAVWGSAKTPKLKMPKKNNTELPMGKTSRVAGQGN